MSLLAWLRRLLVSLGIGTTSFAIMVCIMIWAAVYDKEAEPVITLAEKIGHELVNYFDSLVKGSRWGQVAINHLRERVNMTHVVLSFPAIIAATFIVGIPLNWALGGTRTWLQRIAISFVSIPTTVLLAVALFTFNALYPDLYAMILRFAVDRWRDTLAFLIANGDVIPGARKLANLAKIGFSGHHYVIMAMLAMVASFIVNAGFAVVVFFRRPRKRTYTY